MYLTLADEKPDIDRKCCDSAQQIRDGKTEKKVLDPVQHFPLSADDDLLDAVSDDNSHVQYDACNQPRLHRGNFVVMLIYITILFEISERNDDLVHHFLYSSPWPSEFRWPCRHILHHLIFLIYRLTLHYSSLIRSNLSSDKYHRPKANQILQLPCSRSRKQPHTTKRETPVYNELFRFNVENTFKTSSSVRYIDTKQAYLASFVVTLRQHTSRASKFLRSFGILHPRKDPVKSPLGP